MRNLIWWIVLGMTVVLHAACAAPVLEMRQDGMHHPKNHYMIKFSNEERRQFADSDWTVENWVYNKRIKKKSPQDRPRVYRKTSCRI